MNTVFSIRMIKTMEMRDIKQSDLVQRTGIDKGSLSAYMNGRYMPNAEKISKIANALSVSVNYLLGKDDNPQPVSPVISGRPVLMLGKVAAGIPIAAQQDIIGTVYTEKDGELYALRIKGDSMSPRIMDGDTVLVHPQTSAEDGDLVILMIGDDVTCKVLKQNAFGVTLVPFNAAYAPFVFTAAQVDDLHIIGKVVESRHEWN